MRLANRAGARYAVIIADRELETGAAQVKDMASGTQTTQPFEALAKYLVTRTS